ncbi:hypothetical protein HanPI659440_Chr06g0227951 [Helianthus annuus]|nr:hypothetical protein HanPI659440_Chr06g0227951 [Helianthus annuus]
MVDALWLLWRGLSFQNGDGTMAKYAKEGMRVEASKLEIDGTKHDAFVDMIATVFI